MGVLRRSFDSVVYGVVNRIGRLNGTPYTEATPEHLPKGAWKVVHYGIMIPGLPDPLRFFDMIAILGTAANVPIFAAPSLATTPSEDTAWLLLGSALTRDDFRPFQISTECSFAPDRSVMRFGDALTLSRGTDDVRAAGQARGAAFDLVVRPSRSISHFANMTGIYQHWSVLCEYDGTFVPDEPGSEPIHVRGLCTWEYARGRSDIPLPMLYFTYQVLNVDARTQVLMVEIFGPAGLPVQQLVYVRDIDGNSQTYGRDFRHSVTEYLPPVTTPDGVVMRLPRRFRWSVAGNDGAELIAVEGTCNDDFAYGMAAGYAGSYEYTGRFGGRDIGGRAYIEWIDRRRNRGTRSLHT